MAYTGINKSSLNFNTVLYTGNGASTRTVTGVGFKPDLVWAKKRSAVGSHNWMDAIRTANNYIQSNTTAAASNDATKLKSFDSNGFTVGDDGSINSNNATFASWNWKANGSGSTNTAGSLNSTVSVNATAGFSIVKWVNGTSSAKTIGHGLGVKPSLIILKTTTGTYDWRVYHKSLGATYYTKLNTTDASATASSIWNNTEPTTSVFSTGSGGQMVNNTLVAYCFAEKQGYSKISSYVGNGSASNSPFTYTGFKPEFLMIKRSNGTDHWVMNDNARSSNENNNTLKANSDDVEYTSNAYGIDLLSNGFKPYTADGNYNVSGQIYIYMAFGQSLVGTNNVPCTAR